MGFDPTTAIPVKRREDGLLEVDNFDPSTAKPIPELSEGQKKYVPALTDQDRARSLVELMALEKGEKISTGKKIEWALTSDKARAGVTAVVNTLLTGGLYPVVQGARGAIDDTGDYDLFDRVTRGILYPEETQRFTDRVAAKDEPEWAKITRGVSEDILSYGVAGFGQSMVKARLLARDIARKIDTAADAYVAEKVGTVSAEGVATAEQSVLMNKIADVKEGFKNAMILKLKAIDTQTGKTVIQQYAEQRSIISMIGDELEASGFSAGLSIKPVKGQTVSFKGPEGKEIVGKIAEITGNRVIIDMEGRQIVATLSQLRPPEPTKEELRQQSKEIVGKSIANQVEQTLGKEPAPESLKSFIREQTGQTQDSKELLGYLKEKYADQIKAGQFEDEIERKLAEPLAASKTKNVVRENTGQIKDDGELVSERQAYLGSLRDQVKAATAAEKYTKQEVFDAQSAFTELVNKSGLEAKDKAKFINAIREIQNGEDLSKAMKPSLYQSGPNKGQIKDIGLEAKMGQLLDAMERKGLASDILNIKTDGIAVEYKQAIEKVQESFDLKNRSAKTLEGREKMRQFVDRMKAAGQEVSIPKDKLDLLDKPVLNDIEIDQLREVKKTVEHLARLGKTKQAAREATYVSKKENIKAQLLNDVEAINSKKLPQVPIGENTNQMAKRYIELRNYITKTRVGLTPMEGLADITGMQEMKKALDKSFGQYLSFNDENFKKWVDITKGFDEGNFKRIGAYAILQQEGGAERLANSGIEANIKLTPEEQKAYDFARDTFDSYFPKVEQYAREVYNESVGKVKNYVSFMSDYEAMSDLDMYDRFGQRPQEAIAARTKTVEQGFRKSRAAVSDMKIETNIDKIFRRHLDDVAYMLTMGRDIKMFSEVVNSPEMREALGDIGTMAWLQYLDLMARKGGVDAAKRIAALDIIRANMGAGVLAFRISSALVQLSSFGDTMATLGAEWATRGASNIATSKEWRNFIMDNFPEIKKAVGDDIAYREFGEDFLGKLSRIGMTPLQIMDGTMRSTAASGAYEKLAAERGITVDLNTPNKELIEEATKLMRQSQGSSFFKDQPLALTTGYGLTENQSLNKTILQFQSFMLGRWDNINRQIWRLGIEEKNFSKAFMSLFWLLIFGFAGEEGLRRIGNKGSEFLGKPKKKDDPFIQDVAFNVAQSVPLAGSIASSIAYGSTPVPTIKTINDLFSGASMAIKGEQPSTKLKGVAKSTGAILSMSGIAGSSTLAQFVNERIKTRGKKMIRD